MPTFNLTQQQYESLIALAQRSTVQPDGSIDQAKAQELQSYLREIEEAELKDVTKEIMIGETKVVLVDMKGPGSPDKGMRGPFMGK